MKHRIILTLAALLCLATAFAGNLLIDNVTLKPGETKDLKISLASTATDVYGVQFDVKLPSGFTLESINDKVYQIPTNQPADMTCNVSYITGNTYRFVLYSNSLQKLKGGELMGLNLKVNSTTTLGNYDIRFNEIAFSNIDGKVTKENEVKANAFVTDFIPDSQNIQVENVAIRSGQTAPLTIRLLESISGCGGIQFDLLLPEGISIEKDSDGKEYKIASNQANDISCSLKAVDDKTYRFVLYSNSLKEFVSGNLMDINLKAVKDKTSGNYPLSISNVILSDKKGNIYNDSGASAIVLVTGCYSLSYLVDGKVYKTYELEEGANITPESAPTKEGYTFSGWSEIPVTMPAHDVIVEGSFSINKYKLFYQVDGVEYKNYEVEYGASITAEAAPIKEGHTFSGWSTIPETMPAHDVTVTGTFSKGKYKITYKVDGTDYKTISYDYGSTITAEAAPTKEGYTFSGWSEIPATMPAHDVTVEGSFTVNKYKLVYQVDGVEYKNYEIEFGKAITPETAPTKEGHTFSGWSEIPKTMPAKDVTITGSFSINKYKLVYKVDGEEYKSYDVEYGTAITPEPSPTKEGYTFSGWSTIPETMPAEDVTVTGTFAVNKYKLVYKVDGAEYKSYEIEYGKAITAEPVPSKEGYTFSGWSEIPETMPAHDVTITGTFLINKYKLVYMVDGEVYKSYDVEYGATITAETAPTKEGFEFSGWSDIPETMPANDVTVTGTFKAIVKADDGTIEVSGGEASVTGGETATGDVDIPESVSVNGVSYPVTTISDGAYQNNANITSATIPESVTTIGANAFNGCSNLGEVNVGKSVSNIGSKAFANLSAPAAARRAKTRGASGLVIKCYATSVPTTAADAFENTSIGNATLLVDDNSVVAYKSASPWSGFGTIMGFSEATGINGVLLDNGDHAKVFSIDGKPLNEPQKGVNIIRMDNGKTMKVVVK